MRRKTLAIISSAAIGAVLLALAPDPAAVAGAMDELSDEPESRLRGKGEAGRRRVEDITWDRVIDRLTEAS